MQDFLDQLFGDAITADRRVAIFTVPHRQTRFFAHVADVADFGDGFPSCWRRAWNHGRSCCEAIEVLLLVVVATVCVVLAERGEHQLRQQCAASDCG